MQCVTYRHDLPCTSLLKVTDHRVVSYLLCISTSKCMLVHAFRWSKMIKNIRKSVKRTFFIMHMRGSCKTHVEKWRKKFNKIPNEQPAFRCQPAFRSYSQSLTNKLFSSFFFMSLTWASHVHNFLMFFIVFDHGNALRKHAFAGQNTQQLFTSSKLFQHKSLSL